MRPIATLLSALTLIASGCATAQEAARFPLARDEVSGVLQPVLCPAGGLVGGNYEHVWCVIEYGAGTCVERPPVEDELRRAACAWTWRRAHSGPWTRDRGQIYQYAPGEWRLDEDRYRPRD